MLKNMFDKQETLMERYLENDSNFPEWPIDLKSKQHQKFVRDVLLNCSEEIFEALRHFKNWKPHRKTEITNFDHDEFLEEMVDAFKFFTEALIMCGVTAEDFLHAYNTKDSKCHKRLDDGY
jgi:hypothetical protein